MSIRTNPMKAVPTLLKRLVTVEKKANLNDLKSELIKIKNLFSMVKKNEEELLEILTVVDGYLCKKNISKLMEEKEDICQRIRISTQKLLPAAAIQSTDIEAAPSSGKIFQDVKLDKREEVNRALPLSPQLGELEILKKYQRFPRFVGRVYTGDGENVFHRLIIGNLIVPHGNDKCPVVNKFKINSWVHHKSVRSLLQAEEQLFEIYSQIITSSHLSDAQYGCLAPDRQKVKLSDGFAFKSTHWKVVLNVGTSYLNFEPPWMAKMKGLEALHLGRWQDSATHHIEVESEEFLKELRHQKDLSYLSLRGISRIFELPPSIVQLESLEILDLNACHNLETLPNDISSLRNLIHLDLSQCYLLDKMPKGIEKLAELQVLKGFVIGSSSKTPCRISDLANLKKLERLSIHIGTGVVIQDGEFESLRELSKLEHLKISWGVSDTRYSDIQIILPSSLEKLHLEGFPGQKIPEWLKPSELLQRLKVLNITGGKLEYESWRK